MFIRDKLNIYSYNGTLIRFLLAIFVIIHHAFYLSANVHDPIYEISSGQLALGGISVYGFFFFSGLYVNKSMHKAKNCLSFIISRIKRIFPPLIIVVLCCAFILGPILSSLPIKNYFTSSDTYLYLMNAILIPIHNLPGVFEQNIYGQTVNGALWTLPVEFMCYIALLVIMFSHKHIFKSNKFFYIIDALGLFSSFALYCLCKYLNIELFDAAFMAVTFFFIGCVYFDFKEKIKLSWKLGIPSIVLFVCFLFTPFANYASIIFMPYALVYLSLGVNQLKCKWKIFAMSYEIYLIGFPIQQTIVALFGGHMDIFLNLFISITTILIIMLIVIMLKNIFYNSIKNKQR